MDTEVNSKTLNDKKLNESNGTSLIPKNLIRRMIDKNDVITKDLVIIWLVFFKTLNQESRI